MSILDTLASPVAFVLKNIHEGLSTFLPSGSGWAWGLSIVFLTITVRVALFPLFVKQIKSQRRMAELQPKIKAIQAKHKGDRETLNVELMKLYKDHGTNPISGCLPLILQLPVFFALFRVMNEFKPDKSGAFHGKYGISGELISQGAHAKVFGAPISAAFNSSANFLHVLGGDATTVKIVATLMIVTMGATTFLTQKQMMARAGAVTDPQQVQIQKIMLYVLPFSFAIFGFSFPVGVLLYWLTTNVWSMGQQRYVIARMPVVVPGSGAPAPAAKPTRKGFAAKLATSLASAQLEPGTADPVPAAVAAGTPASSPAASPAGSNQTFAQRQASRPPNKGGKKNAGSRKNKARKGGRR